MTQAALWAQARDHRPWPWRPAPTASLTPGGFGSGLLLDIGIRGIPSAHPAILLAMPFSSLLVLERQGSERGFSGAGDVPEVSAPDP